MTIKRFFNAILLLAFVSAIALSCRKDSDATGDDDGSGSDSGDDGFVTNTKDTTFSNAVVINYTDSAVTVTNPFSASGVSVVVTNGNVVATSTVTGTEIYYVLSGKVSDGQFKLYSDYKFNLVLNGVSITNADGPAINIQSGKKVTVLVLGGTNNRLIDGSTYATSTEDQKAAFFSEGQLNFTGTGNLSVTGKYKHGICSDDYIYVYNGNITVISAVSDGIHANDYFKMDAGTVTVTASGDGIDCEEGYVIINGGNITVTSADDGITASYDGTDVSLTPYLLINGGIINITTIGDKGNAISSESYMTVNSSGTITSKVSGKASKGFKTGGNFTFTNGTAVVTTSGNAFYDTDDADIAAAAGVNCDGNFSMANGTLTITSSGTGGKGITSDGTFGITGGTINITATGSTFTYGTLDSEAKGIKSDGALSVAGGNITISAADDGIKSETSITVNDGIINITKSTEGVEAPFITFNGGNVTVAASDDCLNATKGNGGETDDGSLITFAGGTISLNTSGGDGIDSNGSVVMSDGTVIAQGPPSQPEVAIDVNGSFNISGGVLMASGPNAGNMIEATSSTSAQYTVLAKISGNVAAGTLFTIQNSSGTNLVTYAPARSAYYFVYSSSLLQSGSTYKVLTGGSYSGGSNTNGLYSGGTLSGGTQKGTFTVSNKLTTVTL